MLETVNVQRQLMKFLTILVFFSVNLVWHFLANASGNDTDHLSLLKFKEAVTSDPHGVLNSWNDSAPFCNWIGITCRRRDHRVTSIELAGQNLVGFISPNIGNLSFLRIINLENNSFHGVIPQEVGRLFRLQQFILQNNAIGGEIPVRITNCSQLTIISLSYNKIVGTIPTEIGSLEKLKVLTIRQNNITGELPSSISNISALSIFVARNNRMEGTIPEEMGKLTKLTQLSVEENKFSGLIPPFIFNITSLNLFLVSGNQFHGILPDNICQTLPNLQQFDVGANNFSGSIPKSISNCSHLEIIEIPFNNLVGKVPTDLGKLQSLWRLNMQSNNLGNSSKDDLAFLQSLTNCSKLQILSFTINQFGGVLPSSVVNLSTQLQALAIGKNQISGTIPVDFDKFVNLVLLSMDFNLFTGSIPSSIGNLQQLQALWLSDNELSGEIPSSVGNITHLGSIILSGNKLEGSIPSSLGHCKLLRYLKLSRNRLIGEIPSQILLLSALSDSLVLAQNMLSGVLPPEVGKLTNLYRLNLAVNNLSGKIPETIGGCENLQLLFLNENSFEGSIPSSLVSMKGLRVLDLSRNNLSGQIPRFLQDFSSLLYLNLSFNNLEGEVPTKGVFGNASTISLIGNNKLCGGIPELNLPKCPFEKMEKGKSSHAKPAVIVSSVILSVVLTITFVLLYWKRSLKKKSLPLDTEGEHFIKVSYGDIYRATSGFSPDSLIGSGGFGSVYKGSLAQIHKPVAVKVLNLDKKDAANSFKAECRALRNIRHRNLVKILTYCSTIDYKRNEFKALVYEFMAQGSLEGWLRPSLASEGNSRNLNFLQRLNISLDIASALHYLHDHCEVVIIHCDLKPSNILLDEDMVAHLSDFGLAKLFSTSNEPSLSQTSTIEGKGTVGYAAPEYGTAAAASKEGDVYSYGILLLEMFSGRKPTDEMFKDELSLHEFVKAALPARLLQIIDPSLLPRDKIVEVEIEDGDDNGIKGEEEMDNDKHRQITQNMQKCLLSILEIGVACSIETPKDRMNMMDVTRKLQSIKTDFLNNSGGSRRWTTRVLHN